MAPPRTSNSTRQAPKKSQKHLDEDMHASDNVDPMEIDDEEHDERSTTSAQELIANMVEGQRKRHLSKKRKVIKAHDTSAKTVQDAIETVFSEHEEKASAAHKAQLKRLKELLAAKAQLETAMEEKLTALRAGYEAHASDVQLVLDHKLKELK